jgi:hypothetical protein
MKIRMAYMMARLIEKGDVLIRIPYDQGGQRIDQATVIGTVSEIRDHGSTRSWLVRDDNGVEFEHPDEPEGVNVLTAIHVPPPQSWR